MRPSLLENCTKRRKSASEGSGGKVVTSPKQAIAIALSEAKMPMRGQRTAKNKAKK
jgi:hypothetical protein